MSAHDIHPMDNELTRYINDHLAGSSGALLLIQEIADKHDVPEAKVFFQELHGKVMEDRRTLEGLLKRIDQAPSGLLKLAGGIAARVGGIKLLWEKVEPGKLGMFEALEMLALGIQGKRLLWIVMDAIAHRFPEWRDLDFKALEMEAIEQRDEVEEWRLDAAMDAFLEGRKSDVSEVP